MPCGFLTSAPAYYCVTFAQIIDVCSECASNNGVHLFTHLGTTCIYNGPTWTLCGSSAPPWVLTFVTGVQIQLTMSGAGGTLLELANPLGGAADGTQTYVLYGTSDTLNLCDFTSNPATATIVPNSDGICSGDPHFIGFENDRFDFHGVPDRTYNLLSDYNVSVNANFGDYAAAPGTTYLKELGVLVGTNEVGFTKIHFSSKGGVYINGKLMKKKKEEFPTGIITEPIGSVEITMNKEFFGNAMSALHEDIGGPGVFQNGIIIHTGTYKLSVAKLLDACVSYMCIQMGLTAMPLLSPHGIVGQTADFDGKPRIGTGPQGEGVIDGLPEDYEVKELFNPEFTFARFAQLPKPQLKAG